MTATAIVRHPGGCRPSRRAHRVVVSRRSQQGSGIDDGRRFGKLFISFLTSLMAYFSLVAGISICSSDRTDNKSKLRALLQTVS